MSGVGDMHDSGKRQDFGTGAVRDAADDKPALELISPLARTRLGHWLALGARKYTKRNWEAGIPIMRCVASLLRHTDQFISRDEGEDHAAAMECNAMFILHYLEAIKRGILPEDLDDRPDYRARKASRKII